MAKSDNTTNRVNFTAARVRNFKCTQGKKESYLWDEGCSGLGIRAFSSGKKTYIFQAWINGKTRRGVIGPVDSFDIDKARAKANELQLKARDNITPAKVKRDKQAQETAEEQEFIRSNVTLGQVWQEYINDNEKSWGEKHLNDHIKAVQKGGLPWARGKGRITKAGCLYPLTNETIGTLSASKIKQWLEHENKTRAGVAAQTYRLLFACLNWVSEQEKYHGLIDLQTLKTKAVKKTVVKLQPKSDVLQKEQLAVFFQQVRHIQNPVISAFVQALLLTGARRGELNGLKWSDVDFQWNSLTIRDKDNSKGGLDGVRVIPLTPYVASLIYQLPRRNQWVFSSPSGATGKLTEPRKSVAPAFKAAGIEGLTLHGLRRSFATLSEWVEVPAGIVAQIMGHKPSATAEKHYKKRPIDLLRKWHIKIEKWVLEQAGLSQPEQIDTKLTVIEGAL